MICCEVKQMRQKVIMKSADHLVTWSRVLTSCGCAYSLTLSCEDGSLALLVSSPSFFPVLTDRTTTTT